MPASSQAAAALGLGGGSLGQQVLDETDEQRRKRMLEIQQKQLMGPQGSLASATLFGGMGRAGY